MLPDSARELIESGALAHLVTLNPDGSPQVTCVWIGLEGEELVSGHLPSDQRKLENVRRDPRVALSLEGSRIHPPGLKEYLVVHGRARLEEGGAPELLQRLAHVYLGPEVKFPPMENPPRGHVMHTTVERIGGVGPWMESQGVGVDLQCVAASCLDNARKVKCHIQANGETIREVMEPEDVFRNAHDRIAEKAAEFGWRDPVPFLCECSDIRCFARLSMTLEEFESLRASPSRYVMKPAHQLSGGFILEQDDRVAVAEKLYAGHET